MTQKRKAKPGIAHDARKPAQESAQEPLIRFFRFIPDAREPQRADKSAAGSMPMRAYSYCEAMTTASAFGWYLFPPMSFTLMWDGRLEVVWTYEGADGWFPLKRAQFPHFAETFDQVAPPDVRPYVRMITERMFPTLPILSHVEIARGVEVKSLGAIS